MVCRKAFRGEQFRVVCDLDGRMGRADGLDVFSFEWYGDDDIEFLYCHFGSRQGL